jgi:hypothetical protein
MATMPIGSKFTESLQAWIAGTGQVVQRIGEAAVIRIRQRTQYENTDRYGVQFKPYSEGYAKRKRSPVVNLTQRGRMLGNLQVLGDAGTTAEFFPSRGTTAVRESSGQFASRGNTQIQIGFSDPEQAIKAYAHISGKSKRWKYGPHVRDFGGLEESWIDTTVDREFTSYGSPASTSQAINIPTKF